MRDVVMNIYTVKIAELLSFDTSQTSSTEKKARVAVVSNTGVNRDIAEKFGVSNYLRGVEVHYYSSDEAPKLLLSEATLSALNNPTIPKDMKVLPVLAEDVASQFAIIAILSQLDDKLLVMEYEPGEKFETQFKW